MVDIKEEPKGRPLALVDGRALRIRIKEEPKGRPLALVDGLAAQFVEVTEEMIHTIDQFACPTNTSRTVEGTIYFLLYFAFCYHGRNLVHIEFYTSANIVTTLVAVAAHHLRVCGVPQIRTNTASREL